MNGAKNRKRFGRKILAILSAIMMITIALAPTGAMADSSMGGGMIPAELRKSILRAWAPHQVRGRMAMVWGRMLMATRRVVMAWILH
jgi:hypothetical protein